MNRDDAEEAMEACDETDPFNNGRLLSLRWGKNVKKMRRDDSAKKSIKRRQTEGINSNKCRKISTAPFSSITSTGKATGISTYDGLPRSISEQTQGIIRTLKVQQYDPEIHGSRAIRVKIPTIPSRFHFISTTASYVAKDPEIEERLNDEERGNSFFDFLKPVSDDDKNLKEKIFYRWRVYSFCQGDTYSIWRTEPFLMFSHGRYWIPPPLDADAANMEKAKIAEKEHRHRQQKEDRANRELMTGRQFEQRKRRGEFGANNPKLTPEELRRFDLLVRKKLSLSRKTVCEAMSFCFDNCAAALEVSTLLKEALLNESDGVTNDIRIARLYLLSDTLFNSQQPGVRNAFMYRTTIESMAIDAFRELGNIVRRKEQRYGRITVHKLRKAVSAVLGAWTEWGVYNGTFVDELELHFEGREVEDDTIDGAKGMNTNAEKTAEPESSEEEDDVVIHGQRGDWKEVSDESNEKKNYEINAAKAKIEERSTPSIANQIEDDDNIRNESGINYNPSDINDGELVGEDINGEDLVGEDLDGEILDVGDLEGEELDGEIIYGTDVDGENFDVEALTNEGFDGDEAP